MTKIAFVLVPGFPLMSFAAALEPLRAANHLADAKLFDISIHSDGGGWISSSCGMGVDSFDLPASPAELSYLLVVAGGHHEQWSSLRIDSCLRRAARYGTTIGGITAGPFFLARAGLFEGQRFTLHYEHVDLLREMFPDLRPEPTRFVSDGKRLTCGGGIAALDLMHSLISERVGSELARRVAEWFLYTKGSIAGDPQRGSVSERHELRNDAVARAIALMEKNISPPASREDIAAAIGLSSRHLERLFLKERSVPFSNIYMQIRMAHAERLLWQSDLSISDVGMASGFGSLPHFSSSFAKKHGKSPRLWRHQMRKESHWLNVAEEIL